MNNLMLDIETLDTKDSAVVLSIGAVKFNESDIGDSFYSTLSIDPQLAIGRTISGNTIKWWMQQNDNAKFAAFAQDCSPEIALVALADFMDDGDYQVWGNGAVFDNAIVTSMYNMFDIKRPWTYKNDRCYRTIRALVKEQYPEADVDVKYGVAHNALDDAVAQALSLQKMWAVMKGAEL